MALNDLAKYLKKNKSECIIPVPGSDADIACNIVDILFHQTNDCLMRDRSTVKLNMLEKGLVSTGLIKVMPGTKQFLSGMYHDEMEKLLDDIERELMKRGKILNKVNYLISENDKLNKEITVLRIGLRKDGTTKEL